jgi:hypothetical protein
MLLTLQPGYGRTIRRLRMTCTDTGRSGLHADIADIADINNLVMRASVLAGAIPSSWTWVRRRASSAAQRGSSFPETRMFAFDLISGLCLVAQGRDSLGGRDTGKSNTALFRQLEPIVPPARIVQFGRPLGLRGRPASQVVLIRLRVGEVRTGLRE